MRGAKPVSEDLAKRVRDVAQELGYEVNLAASQLRSGQTRVIGVQVPDLADPFFTAIVTGLEALAQSEGYEIIIANSSDNAQTEARRLDALLAWRPAGMVVIPCTDKLPERLIEEKDHVPFVVADRVAQTSVVDTVMIDNEDAGFIAAKYLGELGHRDVLLVASDMGLKVVKQRCTGAEKALATFGGKTRVVEVSPKPTKATAALSRWFERNPLPTAIVALTNMTTLATLSGLAQRRMIIPDHVSLMGFDDYPWMSARRTALTAVRQPISEITDAIWEQLTARMGGDTSEPSTTVIRCTLEIRDSTRAVGSLASEAPIGGPPADDAKKSGRKSSSAVSDKTTKRIDPGDTVARDLSRDRPGPPTDASAPLGRNHTARRKS
jgi:LacI family transcriptional regulator